MRILSQDFHEYFLFFFCYFYQQANIAIKQNRWWWSGCIITLPMVTLTQFILFSLLNLRWKNESIFICIICIFIYTLTPSMWREELSEAFAENRHVLHCQTLLIVKIIHTPRRWRMSYYIILFLSSIIPSFSHFH